MFSTAALFASKDEWQLKSRVTCGGARCAMLVLSRILAGQDGAAPGPAQAYLGSVYGHASGSRAMSRAGPTSAEYSLAIGILLSDFFVAYFPWTC